MQALMERDLVAQKPGRAARLRGRVAGRLAVVAASLIAVVAGGISPASASTTGSTDLTGGAGDTFFSAITSYFQDHVIISVLGLFALTVGVAVLMKWGRKGAKSS